MSARTGFLIQLVCLALCIAAAVLGFSLLATVLGFVCWIPLGIRWATAGTVRRKNYDAALGDWILNAELSDLPPEEDYDKLALMRLRDAERTRRAAGFAPALALPGESEPGVVAGSRKPTRYHTNAAQQAECNSGHHIYVEGQGECIFCGGSGLDDQLRERRAKIRSAVATSRANRLLREAQASPFGEPEGEPRNRHEAAQGLARLRSAG